MLQPQPNDGFEWTQAPWGFVLRCRPLSEVADHFFTAGDLRLGMDAGEWHAVEPTTIEVDWSVVLSVDEYYNDPGFTYTIGIDDGNGGVVGTAIQG